MHIASKMEPAEKRARSSSPSEHEAKLMRQQALNKAAQQRYRQRRKQRQECIETSLQVLQQHNAMLAAQLATLQAALATSGPPAAAAVAPVGGAPAALLATPAVGAPSMIPVPNAPLAAAAAGCWPGGMPAGAAAAPCNLSGTTPAAPSDGGAAASTDTGGNAAGDDEAFGLPSLTSPAETVHRARVAALATFLAAHPLHRPPGDPGPPPPPLDATASEHLCALVAAAADSCAAALDISSILAPTGPAAATSPEAAGRAAAGSKQRWLQVIADAALSDGQMHELLRLRGALLDDLGRCLSERHALAEALAAGCWPQESTAALGYAAAAARAALSARDAVGRIEASVAEEGRLVRAFTHSVLVDVLNAKQAATALASDERPIDALSMANALSDLHEMTLRLTPAPPTAAAITAAAAAAGAAIRRAGSAARLAPQSKPAAAAVPTAAPAVVPAGVAVMAPAAHTWHPAAAVTPAALPPLPCGGNTVWPGAVGVASKHPHCWTPTPGGACTEASAGASLGGSDATATAVTATFDLADLGGGDLEGDLDGFMADLIEDDLMHGGPGDACSGSALAAAAVAAGAQMHASKAAAAAGAAAWTRRMP